MTEAKIPAIYSPMNRMMKFMNRIGIPLGPIRVITVIGRTSGTPRSTPVSPVTVDGERYVVSGLRDSNWAKNARAAGGADLSKGRRHEAITLIEVSDPALRERVMRAYPVQVPAGVGFFTTLGVVTGGSQDEFAAAAPLVAIFAVTPADQADEN